MTKITLHYPFYHIFQFEGDGSLTEIAEFMQDAIAEMTGEVVVLTVKDKKIGGYVVRPFGGSIGMEIETLHTEVVQ